MDIDQEQAMHDLERRTVLLQTDLTKCNAETDVLKAEKKELTASLSLEKDNGVKLCKKVETLEATCASLRSDVSGLKSEAKLTLEESARRSTEIEVLRKHLKDEEGVILDLQKRLSQSQEKQWEASGIGSQAVREVDILKKQVLGLENHCRSLSDENEARSAELLSSRKASVQASFALKLKLTEAEEKASSGLTELSRVKKQLEDAKRMAADVGEELKDAKKTHATEREGMEKELSAAKRISDLYKARGEEAEDQLQREVSEGTTRVNSLRELIQVQKEQAKDVLMKAKAEAESIIERQSTELVKVKERVKELEDLEKQRQLHHVPQSPESSASMVKKGGAGTVDVALSGHHHPSSFLSVANMQDRVVEAEEALGKERAERRRLERYLNRVLLEVESKAPIIASQKLDYRRALASHEHISSRLEEAMIEVRELEREAKLARTEKNSVEREVTSLKQVAADLGLQVQVLLRQQLKDNLGRSSGAAIVPADDFPNGSGSVEPSAVISQHLVSFHDVAELQQRNEQLLRVVRKLSEERVSIEKANMDASAAADAAALEESMRELEDLKRARARQEEMVAAIVEQRDMYRLLLAQESQKLLSESSSSDMKVDGGVGSETSGGIKELSRKLVEAESEVRRMTEECEKRSASEADANKGLKNAVDDAAEARREAAHATAEATFARGRYQDLMNTLEQRQSEVETLHKELVTLNALQLSLQRDLEGARADVDSERTRARSLDRANICLSTELSSINQTFERLKDENIGLMQSSQRQESLMDSLQRLERGFTARVAEERSALEESNKRLRNSLEESVNELTEVKGQLSVLEMQSVENLDARKERAAADEARAAATEAREALLREQAESRVLREKVEGLEKQLPSGKKLLGSSGSTSEGQQQQSADESGRPAPSADWSFRVMKAQAAAEEAKEAEVAARNHMKQYQAIAKGKETQLKEVTEALMKSRAAREDDNNAAEKKEEELREEMRKERERTRPLLDGLVEAEKALDVAKREAQTKVADAVAELDSAKRANEQLERQISGMKKEVKQLQAAISSAQENYDRELHEHSDAISRLRDAEERASTMRKSRDSLEETNSKLAEELVKFQAEQKTSEADIKGRMETALEESKALRAQNDLLHSQLSSLAKESEAVMRDRHNRAEAAADAAAVALADVMEQKEGEDNNVVIVEEVSNEVAALQKSLSDLREVVRFLRREREVSEAEKQTAEAQAGRLKASLNQAQVALRSARAELRSVAEEKAKGAVGEEGGGISESEHAKLVAQVTQLSTLRESNTLLRSQLQEAHGKLARLTANVASLEKSVEPAKLAEEKLKANLAEVEAELGVRKREVENWRQRAAMLVQDYQKIDPEDHKKLQSELDAAIRDCKEAQARVKDAEEEGKQVLVRQRATAQSHHSKLQQMIRLEREKHLKEKEELLQERAAAIAKAEAEAITRAEAVKESSPSDATAKSEELDNLKKEHQNLKNNLEHEKKMGERLRSVARNIRTRLAAEEKKTKTLEKQLASTGQSLDTTTPTVERPLIPPSTVPLSTVTPLDVTNWNAGPAQNEASSTTTAISADDTEQGQIRTSTTGGGEPTTGLPATASPDTGLPVSMPARKSATSSEAGLYSTPTGTGATPVAATSASGEEGTRDAELKKAVSIEGATKRSAAPNLAATQSQEQQLMKKRKQGGDPPQQQSTTKDSSNFLSLLSSAPSISQPSLFFGALASKSQAEKSTDFVTQTQVQQQKHDELQKNEESLAEAAAKAAEAVAAAKAAEAVSILKASSTQMFGVPPVPSGGLASSEAKVTAPLQVKGTSTLGSSSQLNLGGFRSSPTLQSSMFGQGSAFVPNTSSTTASLSAPRDTGMTTRTIDGSSISTFATAPATSMKFGSGFGTIRAPPQGAGETAGDQRAVPGGGSFLFLPPTAGGKAPTFGAPSLPVPVPSSHSPGQKPQEWPSSSSVYAKSGDHTASVASSTTTTLNMGSTASARSTLPRELPENNESKLPGSLPPRKHAAQETEAVTLPSAEGSHPPTGDQVAPHDASSTEASAPYEEGEIVEGEGGAQGSLPVITTGFTGPISAVSAKPHNVSRPAGIMSNQERMVLRQKRFGGGAEGSVMLGGTSTVGEAVDSTTGSLRDTTSSSTVFGTESKEARGTQIEPASDVQKSETIVSEGGNSIESTQTGGEDATSAGESAHDRSK